MSDFPASVETPDALWGTDDDAKARNEARAHDKGLEPCATCGRGVRPGNGWLVVVIDGGAHIAAVDSEPDENDPGYMGAWVLGPECGKHVPSGYRTKWNGWDQP